MNESQTIVGYEKVPRVQQPVRAQGRIVYFHTADNPFGNYAGMKVDLAGALRERILMRAYGLATKAVWGRFPKFNQGVHVIPDSRVPSEGTRYHFVDPCNGRNWFMGWCIVDARGRRTIYREWPCPVKYIEGVGYPGVWATPSGRKHDGEMGDAQSSFGFGLGRYRREILTLEGWRPTGTFDPRTEQEVFEPIPGRCEAIEERWMDSRFANTRILSAREEPLTLIEEMDELGMEFVETAPMKTIDDGVELVNDLLDYDMTRPVDATNEPGLFVAESCENTIYALQEWTGQDGQKGATKDPVDIVRWIAGTELEYVDGRRKRNGKVKAY